MIGALLRDLSIQEAEGKSIMPSHIVEFLGVLFDLLRMIILLPDEKVSELRKLLRAWTVCQVATQRQLQSIAGKLQFATTYIKQGRIYDQIGKMTEDDRWYKNDQQVTKDLL